MSETGTTSFEDIKFGGGGGGGGGGNKVKNFVFEEESISIPEQIHIDVPTPIQNEINCS